MSSVETRSTTKKRKQNPLLVKVTQYNVLSSHLGGANYFTACNPNFLNPATRLEKLKEKLLDEIESNSIICLQEVSTTWAGPLHAFFASNNYSFITALYGGRWDGYMGVAIAVPQNFYEILEVDITKIADTKKLPKKPKPTPFMQWIFFFQSFFVPIFNILKNIFIKPVVKYELWDTVTWKSNQMISTRLKLKDSDKQFVVGYIFIFSIYSLVIFFLTIKKKMFTTVYIHV
jgi:hypothetical protein